MIAPEILFQDRTEEQREESKTTHQVQAEGHNETLNRQLSDSGTDPQEVEFDIEQSVTGTQYVMMSVTREQHDRMLAEVAAR